MSVSAGTQYVILMPDALPAGTVAIVLDDTNVPLVIDEQLDHCNCTVTDASGASKPVDHAN